MRYFGKKKIHQNPLLREPKPTTTIAKGSKKYLGGSKNRGGPPKSSICSFRVFHYFHHPFWGVNFPLFLGWHPPNKNPSEPRVGCAILKKNPSMAGCWTKNRGSLATVHTLTLLQIPQKTNPYRINQWMMFNFRFTILLMVQKSGDHHLR